jgi:hypothetical protein
MSATDPPGVQPGAAEAATEAVNQGATGTRPLGESPASADASSDRDAFDERPEAFVGAAFVGGFALAMILRRVVR